MGRISKTSGIVAFESPLPIDIPGKSPTYKEGSADIAFRLVVDQADKIRARDDLMENRAGLYFSVWAPIKIPTCGQIEEMRLDINSVIREWSIFKANREADYK